MSFQRPELLWLLLLLALPLLLYLLPMPRRRVATSALFLWERFLRSERFGRTSERFRRVLGFALFAAILASLILAAAGPRFGHSPVRARRLAILIDASASMSAFVDGAPNIERAKAAAARLIESLDSTTQLVVAATAGDTWNVVAPLAPASADAALRVQQIAPSGGPVDLSRLLEEAHRLWGGPDAEAFVFTDAPLPDSPWGDRAHAWIAPAAGDNAAVIALNARRRGKDVVARFTLANFGRSRRTLAGRVLADGATCRTFQGVELGPGDTADPTIRFEDPKAAAIEVALDANDALAADDHAAAVIPTLDQLRIRVAWPQAGRHNAYVAAVLSALQDEGLIGALSEADAAATVFVDHAPATWPEGGAIILYPLRSGAVEVKGLRAEAVTVTRQAAHPLLRDVDLRGLTVKGAVEAAMPAWAEPLAWAGDMPLIWTGETGKTKVLFVGLPLAPSGSRFPLVASFPVLMRNAFEWMLQPPRSESRPSGRTGVAAGDALTPEGVDSERASVLSAAESDLRRDKPAEGETIPHRFPLAFVLVAVAAVLLPVEWGLFHKRLTE